MSETFQTEIEIAAPPDKVFDHFVQPEQLVRWMGDYARLDARPSGEFSVDINGVIIRGNYVRVERPELVEIAWGEAGNGVMPPGSTRLLIRFEVCPIGTRVVLSHSGLHPEEARKHAIGWPHFLGRLETLCRGLEPGPDPFAPSA